MASLWYDLIIAKKGRRGGEEEEIMRRKDRVDRRNRRESEK